MPKQDWAAVNTDFGEVTTRVACRRYLDHKVLGSLGVCRLGWCSIWFNKILILLIHNLLLLFVLLGPCWFAEWLHFWGWNSWSRRDLNIAAGYGGFAALGANCKDATIFACVAFSSGCASFGASVCWRQQAFNMGLMAAEDAFHAITLDPEARNRTESRLAVRSSVIRKMFDLDEIQ